MMDVIKNKLHVVIEPIQTELNRLSTRERMIVYGSAIALAFVLAFIILIWVGSSASSYQRKIRKSQQNIQKIHEIGARYQQIEKQVSQLDRMILQAPSNFQLATELEKLANANQIQIDSFKEKAGPQHEFYEETQVILSIKDVDIRSLIDFLQSIENSGRFMLITNLNIKPAFKDPTKLSVQAVISTFSPL
ncbi:MAG: type 4a pilus biogenesis protein PilO [Bdellovibrionales bacterium]|nr:type 4a pilus biogenesis protein PilO [Bdellovibrionales bacterium]